MGVPDVNVHAANSKLPLFPVPNSRLSLFRLLILNITYVFFFCFFWVRMNSSYIPVHGCLRARRNPKEIEFYHNHHLHRHLRRWRWARPRPPPASLPGPAGDPRHLPGRPRCGAPVLARGESEGGATRAPEEAATRHWPPRRNNTQAESRVPVSADNSSTPSGHSVPGGEKSKYIYTFFTYTIISHFVFLSSRRVFAQSLLRIDMI